MTKEIENLLNKIQNHHIFETYPFYFIGGTALSVYLDHRISYDVDISSTIPLPATALKAFAFSLKATYINDRAKSSAFRINSGKQLDNYFMKFMVDGVKLEFAFFDDTIRQEVLQNSTSTPYKEGSKLKILPLKDIIVLKAIALFNREKSRDLFDMAIILERNLIDIKELERIYSFNQHHQLSLFEYIDAFDGSKDDEGDTSLDFLPRHEHYKVFAKLSQDERFDKCKLMFLEQFNQKQKEKLQKKHKHVLASLKDKNSRFR